MKWHQSSRRLKISHQPSKLEMIDPQPSKLPPHWDPPFRVALVMGEIVNCCIWAGMIGEIKMARNCICKTIYSFWSSRFFSNSHVSIKMVTKNATFWKLSAYVEMIEIQVFFVVVRTYSKNRNFWNNEIILFHWKRGRILNDWSSCG